MNASSQAMTAKQVQSPIANISFPVYFRPN